MKPSKQQNHTPFVCPNCGDEHSSNLANFARRYIHCLCGASFYVRKNLTLKLTNLIE